MKYHGLLNQGATCYLNSVLQVLFMTKDFREAVERDTSKTPGSIDHHLKQLFEDLKKDTANTCNITKTLGIDSRVGVYKQHDAAEYFEKVLSLTSPEASQIFGGLLTHKNICSQCRTEKDNDERFWHLPLALVDSFGKENHSVVDGIEEYFRPYVFSSENQMYCDKCDAKSDATNKCVIKNHPEVLMLLLKRFEFDYRYMTYVKIYCTVDVPFTLQIPENQRYELYAAVDHFGDLRSGHYTATIKDDKSWYRFSDDMVTLLNYQPFQEKSSTAYLLFYRKTNDTQDIREESTPGGFLPATTDINEQRQDAGEIREREEVEGAAEAGDDKQRDEGEIMEDDEEHMAGKAEAAKTEPSSRDPQLEESVEDQENEGSVNVRQDISEDVGGTHRSSNRNKKRKQQTKEEKDVKRVKEQKTGDDNCQNVEDQNNEGLDCIRQSCSEQIITDTHTRHEDVCVVKQAKEMENKRDEQIQNRADSPVRQAGSSGSKRLAENHEVSSAEKTRHGDSPPRAVGRSPEPCFNVVQDKKVYAMESKPINHQECNEERNSFSYLQDAQAVKHRDGGKIMSADDEDMGGKAEGGMREPLSRETQLEESVEDRDTDSGRPDINHYYKDEKTGEDEQSEKKRKSLTKYFDSNVEHADDEQNISEDLGGTQEVGQDDQGCKQISRNTNKKNEQQGKEKRDVKRVKELKRRDDTCQHVEDVNNEGLDGIRQDQSEQKITDTHTRHEDVYEVKQAKELENKRDEHIQNRADSPLRQEALSGYKRLAENHEVSSVKKTRHGDSPPRAEGRSPEPCFNVEQQDNGFSAQKRKPIGHQGKIMTKDEKEGAQRSSSRNIKCKQQTKEEKDVKRVKEVKRGDHNCRDVEDQNNEGLDCISQSCSEQIITDTHTRHEDVCAVKQAKELENKRDEQIQNRADSPVRQTGSSGSKRLAENHEVSSAEKTRHGDSPPKARNVFNENPIKVRRDPDQSRPRGNVTRKSDPKINAEVSMSESDCNMKLCEATPQEPQKRGTTGNTQEETEIHTAFDPNVRTKQKVCDIQEQDAEIKHEKKKRKWWRFSDLRKKQRKKERKHKKTVGCFPFF